MFHIHWYKKVDDNPEYAIAGVLTRRRMWACRCGTIKVKIRGTL